MNKLLRFVYYWMPVLLLGSLIYYQSSYASPDLLPHWSNIDKVLHAGVFGLLSALLCRALNSLPRWHGQTLRLVTAGIVLATLYGLSDEWHQFYVPQRMSDWADVLADLVGSTLGCLTYIGIYLHLNRRITTSR